MPKGPKGEKRPTDVIGTAIKVARIATGDLCFTHCTLAQPNDDSVLAKLGGRQRDLGIER